MKLNFKNDIFPYIIGEINDYDSMITFDSHEPFISDINNSTFIYKKHIYKIRNSVDTTTDEEREEGRQYFKITCIKL